MSDIEFRQLYKDKLYNYRPSWILRWGVTFFFFFLLLVIVVAGFIKYPDIVPATADITTINPPVNLIAKVNGKIEIILIEEGQNVEENCILAVLESPAKWKDVKMLENYISILDSIMADDDYILRMPDPVFLRNNLELGEVQARYADIKIIYTELYDLLFSGFFEEEYSSLQRKGFAQKELLSQLLQKQKLLSEQFHLARKDYQRDSTIFVKQIISESEFELKHQNLLQLKSSVVDMEVSIMNITSSLEQLHYDLKKIELNNRSNKQQLVNKFLQNLHLLKAQVEGWKQNYLIITPINGNVSFTTYWSPTQNVKAGELVLSVVPGDSMTIKVRIQFPIQNSGKVKEGQRVNIKLQNYPYHEFGMLVGHLTKISAVPNDLLYSADVILDKGLTTSYGKKLPTVQHLKGEAEILTDDLSLLMRFFNPLRAIFDNRIKN